MLKTIDWLTSVCLSVCIRFYLCDALFGWVECASEKL